MYKFRYQYISYISLSLENKRKRKNYAAHKIVNNNRIIIN